MPDAVPSAPEMPAASDPVPPGFGQSGGAFLPPPPPGTAEHKTSHALVIGIVIGVLVLLAGGGVAFVLLRGSPTVATAPPHTTAGSPAPPTVATLRPSPAPSSTPNSGNTVVEPFGTVFVPNGFRIVEEGSNAVKLRHTGGDGFITVGVFVGSTATTNTELDQEILEFDQSYLDESAHICSGSSTESDVIQGSGGPIAADGIAICATLTPDSGPAFAATDSEISGLSRASDGSRKALYVRLVAPSGQLQEFLTSVSHKTVFKDASPQ